MQVINYSVYQYIKIISQQNQLRLKQLNKFLYEQQNQVENLAYCIYMQAKLNVISKYNIIVQDIDLYNNFLLQEINIISEGLLSWAKKTAKKVKQHAKHVIKKTKAGINSAKQKLKTIGGKIVDGAKNAWAKCKQIAGKVWDAIKKLGTTVANWVKAAVNYMKRGFEILFKAKQKNMGFSNPNDIKGYSQATRNMSQTAFPCFQVPSVEQKMKSSENLKQMQNIRSSMANGGNVDNVIDNASKSIGNSAVGILKSQITGNKQMAQSAGQQLKAQAQKSEKQSNDKDKLIFQQTQTESSNLKKYFNTIYEQKKIQLKQLIIQQAFNGITPKMLIQGINTNGKQNDIIIGGSNLHFYTNNGDLICEQTILTSNQKIIYESGTKFLGKHMIWQQTENKFVRNNIISQQDETKAKGFLSGGIVTADLILVGLLILSIFGIFYTVKTAIDFLISACTGGIALIAKPLTDAGATPPVAIISFQGVFGIFSVLSLAGVGANAKQIEQLAKETGDQLMRKPIDMRKKLAQEDPEAAKALEVSPEDQELCS